MWGRALATACFATWLWSLNAIAGDPCHWSTLDSPQIDLQSSHPQFEPEPIGVSDYSSFRGLSLSMNKIEAKKAVARLGFDMLSLHSDDRAMDICSRQTAIGTVRFNQRGRINKLELSPFYFAASKANVREFADKVFEHYNVRRAADVDDVCFQDVTCFRGITLTEKLLILRIGNDVQFHIMPRRSESDLTQRK